MRPDDCTENTGTPGQAAVIALSIAAISGGVISDGLVATEPSVTSVILTSLWPITLPSSAMISSRLWPG